MHMDLNSGTEEHHLIAITILMAPKPINQKVISQHKRVSFERCNSLQAEKESNM